MPARRRLALVLALSFAAWAGWECARKPRNSVYDLNGWWTDHFSHLNAVRLLPRMGLDEWRVPMAAAFRKAGGADVARMPPDLQPAAARGYLLVVPGWPDAKPLSHCWPEFVRFYPPGDLLLFAPLAALYQFTPISFTGINRLSMLLLLLFAHVALYFIFGEILEEQERASSAVGLVAGFFAYSSLIHWSMQGFYDAAMIVPLLLCWRFLRAGRGLYAIVAYCAAAFIHFRAYYYAPWVIAAALQVVREKQWRAWGRRQFAAAGVAAVLGGASLGTYALIVPGLMAFPIQSKLSLHLAQPNRAALLVAAALGAVLAGAFIRARAFIDLFMLGWFALLLTQVHQAEPWYVVSLVPWLCAGTGKVAAVRAPLVREARLLAFFFIGGLVYNDSLLPTWLAGAFLS